MRLLTCQKGFPNLQLIEITSNICTTRDFLGSVRLKVLVNEDALLRTHCCPWCFLGCANWETFVADTKFVSATMLRARANGETFVSATMCPQQCVLVCQGLNVVALNLNHIELHLRRAYARPSTTFLCEQQVGSLKPIVNQARSPSWCWSGNHFCRRKSETAETSNFDEFKGKDCCVPYLKVFKTDLYL